MFKFLFRKDADVNNKIIEIDKNSLPKHVAIIMDGNGRWASEKRLPRIAGHREGMQTVKKVTRFASNLGIKVLTLYAFSTENWKRPKEEVDFLMKLPSDFLNSFLPELIEKNVKVKVIGNIHELPEHTLNALEEAVLKTEKNSGLILNFALNYGSRDEIKQAVQHISKQCLEGSLLVDNITEDLISKTLMTKNIPDPELVIRTSGELRISNFLLWQIAYSELIFSDVYWPEFNEVHFTDAIINYQNRTRRFGGI
ncbi:MAG: uppS [Bacillales bacterium]|jgi:undecaprenyl diphosphate synthase|nr:uppS [Bacillales bacterium]